MDFWTSSVRMMPLHEFISLVFQRFNKKISVDHSDLYTVQFKYTLPYNNNNLFKEVLLMLPRIIELNSIRIPSKRCKIYLLFCLHNVELQDGE